MTAKRTISDPAQSSGLFGPASANATRPAKPDPATKHTAEKNKTPPKSGGPGGIDAIETSTPTETTPPPSADAQPQPLNDFSDPRQVFSLFRGCLEYKPSSATNSKLNGAANQVARAFKRLRKERDEAIAKARTCASIDKAPPTREELVGLISGALRDSKATGSDIKGLTATLQTLLPDLFASSQDTKPDPCAVVGYVASFAGRQGSEVVQELGGLEFVQSQLSDILSCSVTVSQS